MFNHQLDKEIIIAGIPVWLTLIASLFVSPGTTLVLLALSLVIGIPVMVNLMESFRIRKALKKNRIK